MKKWILNIPYKVWVHKILRKIGVRKNVRDIHVKENGEPLVDISNDSSFFFNGSLKKPVLLREGVYQRLRTAQEKLPEGIFFKIYSAYRPIEEQKKLWEERLQEVRKEFPQLDEEELERIAGTRVANPYKGYSGHQTGGAIDITLCDKEGKELNMGTRYLEHNDKTKTESRQLNDEERRNRKILLNAMLSAGFKNYPMEWWHYSYGDRMWAVYSQKRECPYGLVRKQDL